ncbi:MAG: 6,7-dimethyl-8-ribityllumazine synthase [Patescibacteria group bacterium]|nr:6,7-dimethyl-8-ribityllumazine synthase [Patescibacteria group bacterium]
MRRKEYTKKVYAGDASKLKIGVVVSRFNSDITEGMLEGTLSVLREWRVQEKNIFIVHVPGSFEVPMGCVQLIRAKKLHAVVALGCVIKGETKHDEYIASAVTQGIMNVMLGYNVPIGFGIITTNNLEQARVRSRGTANKGREAALAVLEMSSFSA